MTHNTIPLASPKNAFLGRAGAWLLESGIQEPEGGVARYYLADARENRPISNEITGYAISTLTYLYSLTEEKRYLNAAIRAGRFLTRIAWDPKLRIFPFEHFPKGSSRQALAYFFDSGIIVRGLLSLWRATGDGEWIEIAQACGRSMSRDFAAGNGEYHPILRLPSKDPLPRAEQWSKTPGCYQLKAALGWYDLFEETGERDFLKWYEDLLEASIRTHAAFLPGAEGDGVMDRLHAYCYFLEGILPRSDRPRAAQALVEGIGKVASHLERIRPQFERSDVCAQLLRLRLLAECAGVMPVDRLAGESEARETASFQGENTDQRIRGGFFFARRGGSMQPHVNPVSTGFAVQALEMWRQYLSGDLHFSTDTLI